MKKLSYMPQSDREKVMIYELLDDLSHVMEKKELMFGFLPTDMPHENIKNWISEWHIELAKETEE